MNKFGFAIKTPRSENMDKVTNPGNKIIYRIYDFVNCIFYNY